MSSFRSFLSLVGFILKSGLAFLWVFPAIWLSPMAQRRGVPWEGSGFSTSLSMANPMPMVMSVILGFMFFRSLRAPGSPCTSIPDGEFLISRPISRRMAYLARIALFFLWMLTLPLVNFGMAARHPDLSFELFKSKTQRTEAVTKLAAYQAAFPDSSVRRIVSAHESLVIPNGNLLITGWSLWVSVLVTLGVQTLMLLIQNIPLKRQQVVVIGVTIVAAISAFGPVAFLRCGERPYLNWLERAFFAFSHHWGGVAVLTLLLAAAVQRFAANRVQEMDVI